MEKPKNWKRCKEEENKYNNSENFFLWYNNIKHNKNKFKIIIGYEKIFMKYQKNRSKYQYSIIKKIYKKNGELNKKRNIDFLPSEKKARRRIYKMMEKYNKKYNLKPKKEKGIIIDIKPKMKKLLKSIDKKLIKQTKKEIKKYAPEDNYITNFLTTKKDNPSFKVKVSLRKAKHKQTNIGRYNQKRQETGNYNYVGYITIFHYGKNWKKENYERYLKTLAHEIAHMKYGYHCKPHKKLTQEILSRFLKIVNN
ncbi:MAG: hypothetical protein ACOCP8_02835 [archaeon]